MKSIPFYLLIIFVGGTILSIFSFYFIYDNKQNDHVNYLNEVVSANISASVDHGTVRVSELIFLDKSSFENNVQTAVNTRFVSPTLAFDYLEDSTGALKAVKVTMTIDDAVYTSTLKVNEI